MPNTETWFQKLFINEAKPALDRHSGGGGGSVNVSGATEIATPEEMDAILANSSISDTGKTYLYTGETTGNYTQDTFYMLIGEQRLQEKEATGNGEVVPDEGYDGLSKVTVNAPSSLKKYLDASKSLYYAFNNNKDITDLTGIIEYSDTENVTNMQSAFTGCTNLTTIPLFDTSKVTSMYNAFTWAPLSEIPFFNTENVTNMYGLFGMGSSYSSPTTSKIKTIPQFNTSNVTNMGSMFGQCKLLESIPLLDTSKVTDMSQMFYNCSNLTSVPHFNTSNVTYMNNMFYECKNLTAVPLFDTSNVTTMKNMFYNCRNITEIPHFNTSKVTDMSSMFSWCEKLTTIPLLDTSKVTNMESMFNACKLLSVIPALDIRSVKYNINNSFVASSTGLTECWLKNIKVNLPIGSGTKYGHLLTMDSLLSLLNETVYTTSTKTLTVGSDNLAKFTGDYEYVKPTGKYLDLDDNEVTELVNGTTKIPVTWCSASDEGAMTVSAYMASKGWSLA